MTDGIFWMTITAILVPVLLVGILNLVVVVRDYRRAKAGLDY